jgi:thiol-activated cytolysin
MNRILAAILLLVACAVKEGNIDQYVSSLGALSVAEESSKTQVDCGDICPPAEQDGNMFCSYERYNQTSRFDQFVALQPNSAALWAGNIVYADQASIGVLTPVPLRQAPLTFSISLENLKSSPVGTMKPPSLSAFRSERNRIMANGIDGAVPAAIDLSISQVHSESQVGFAIGAGANWPSGGKISGSFDFTSKTKQTKILVDFTQAYYTVDVDAPVSPALFFDSSVTIDDIKKVLTSPPVYIQSITYGRRVIFTVETDADETAIEAAIKAAYDGAKVGADVSVNTNSKEVLDRSSIYAFVLGGSGEDAVGAVAGFEGIVNYIKNGGNYSKDSVGAPIAYKLAYLDNTPTQLAFTTDYAEKVCVKNRGNIRAYLESIQYVAGDENGDTLELYGSIGVMVPTEDAPVQDCDSGNILGLWFLDETQFLSIPKTGPWKPVSPVEAVMSDVAFGEGQNICMYASLTESATDEWFGHDRELRGVGMVVPFSLGWNGTHTINLLGERDMSINVTFRVQSE